MKVTDLIPGKHYIGIDKEGREIDCVRDITYCPPEGIVFCLYPTFTSTGELNDIIDFKEYSNEN